MNALLLPGNSSRHGEWVEELKDALSPQFQTVTTQHYRHWQKAEDWADIEYEMGVADEKARDLQPYVIVAKSIGTVIAARGVANGMLYPEKIVLLGVPVKGGAQADEFARTLKHIPIPVVIVQNSADPLGSFIEVRGAFEDISDGLSFVELPGETHDYLDFEAIAKLSL